VTEGPLSSIPFTTTAILLKISLLIINLPYFPSSSICQSIVASLSITPYLDCDFDSNFLQKTSDEFRNKLIDYQLRQEIIAETQDIQELIIRKAFGEAAKTHTPSQMEITGYQSRFLSCCFNTTE
jgi:hypothetical protein